MEINKRVTIINNINRTKELKQHNVHKKKKK